MSNYQLPDLKYDYSALEPIITAQMLEIHHDKHHRAYVTKLNESLEKYDEAITGFKDGVTVGTYRSPTPYELGHLYYKQQQYEKALQSLKRMQLTYQDYRDFPLRPLQYPKSFYLLGKIYEKMNNTSLAIENYKRFLDLWKNADSGIEEVEDAKNSLALLKGIPLQ